MLSLSAQVTREIGNRTKIWLSQLRLNLEFFPINVCFCCMSLAIWGEWKALLKWGLSLLKSSRAACVVHAQAPQGRLLV